MSFSLRSIVGSACASIALVTALPQAHAGELEWHSGSLAKTVATARGGEKPVLIYFWDGRSEYCSKFWQSTMETDQAKEQLHKFVLHSADNGTDAGAKLVERFHLETLPTVVVLTPEGVPEDIIAGYSELGPFLHEIDRIQSGEKTLSSLRKTAATLDNDSAERLQADYTLAVKCQDLGLGDEHDELVASIRSRDPYGKTAVGAELAIDEILVSIVEEGGGEEHMMEWDLDPLVTFAKKAKTEPAKFVSWNKVGHIEAKRGQLGRAHKAFVVAGKNVSDDELLTWSEEVGQVFVYSEADCSSKEKKYVLELAERCLAHVESLEKKPEALEAYSWGEDFSYDKLVAYRLKALAHAHEFNGNEKQAEALLVRYRELVPESEEWDEKGAGKGEKKGYGKEGATTAKS